MALGGGGSDKVLSIKTTLGKDAFMVLRMEGREYLGRLPEYRVDVVGELDFLGKPKKVKLHDLLGTRADVTMNVQDVKREFNGYVTDAMRGDRLGRYETFTFVLRPFMWFMTKGRNSRVFQKKTVKEIVEEINKDYKGKLTWKLNATYAKRDYCVQYHETDFDFVSRLLEEEGIWYFFEHTSDDHEMILIDRVSSHKAKESDNDVAWATNMRHESSIINWTVHEESRSVKAIVADQDYLTPTTKIEATKPATKSGKAIGKMEVYEYPADVVQNQSKDTSEPAATPATARSGVRIEELNSMSVLATGLTNERDMAVGATFKLNDSPHDDGDWLVVGAKYDIEFAQPEANKDLEQGQRKRDGFAAELVMIKKSDGIFRPERKTPRPVVHGPETAMVVGTSGKEIEVDRHGRIKIQFFWDRLGKNDQDSSCWVRVAQPWAGKGFGTWAVPRIGHEVVVSFLGGNPDRPLVTGSVYNAVNVPIWELPAQQTVSGIKTQSTEKGSADTFNELRFDDKTDKEYIWFQAQRDFMRYVKNDAFDLIDKNESVKVTLVRKAVVGKSQFVDIGEDSITHVAKDLHLDVGGDRIENIVGVNQLTVAKASDSKIGGALGFDVTGKIAIKSADAVAITAGGKISLKTSKADVLLQAINLHLKGTAKIVLEAPGGITLKCGGSLVNLSPAGVDIVGPIVKINSGGGGGSATAAEAAEPGSPAKPKKPEELKKKDYDDLFKDPLKK